MKYFFNKFLKPYITKNQYFSICEIGASKGENTDKLLNLEKIELTVIDPCMDAKLDDKYKKFDHIKVYKDLSLNVICQLSESFDCILIDGDHILYHLLKN
ncbi:MAG: hypothetical protein AB4062_14255 [Crocosphaera sp.]